MKICSTCKQLKPYSDFYKKSSSSDGYRWKCISCLKEYNRQHYLNNSEKYKEKAKQSNQKNLETNRKFLIKYLKHHPCQDCGNEDIRVLEFDHLKDKEQNIANLMNRSFSKLKNEIEKCEVVCANCHRIRTHTRSNSWRHQIYESEA